MMSLQPYLPPVSGEAGAVYALLQVIADPKQAKATLDKLVEERRKIEEETAKQQQLIAEGSAQQKKQVAEAKESRVEAEKLADQAHADLGANAAKLVELQRANEEFKHREQRLGEQQLDLEETDKRQKQLAAELKARTHELVGRSAAMEKQEIALDKREADLAVREKQLADDIAENQKWLAGLKPPRTR